MDSSTNNQREIAKAARILTSPLAPHPVQQLVPSARIISSSILNSVPVSIAVVIASLRGSESLG